eukprot:scaffold26931_cov52-Cyclotella_meneghiniana.AAC.5
MRIIGQGSSDDGGDTPLHGAEAEAAPHERWALGGWKTAEMRRATVTSGRCWVERARVPGA